MGIPGGPIPPLDSDKISREASAAAHSPPIAVDVIAALFPETAADAHKVYTLVDMFAERARLTIEECMRQAGFDYQAPSEPDQKTRFFDFPDLDHIAEHGFGPILGGKWVDPLEHVPLGLRDQFAADLT